MQRLIFNKTNHLLMILATLVMIIGYVIMAQGNRSFSVVLLIVCYAGLYPLALLWSTDWLKPGQKNPESDGTDQ